MKIGLRTIKTVIASVLAILIATQLHLLYATAAGIIAILSVGNTKKTSLKSGLGRVLSLGLAIVLSFICFITLGFHPWSFGVFLLVFIPLSVRFNLSDAIVVNSVLITHFLVEKSFSWQMIINETLLMTIGVGLALLLNVYMPDNEKQLKEEIKDIEEDFRTIIFAMAAHLNLEKIAPLDDACLVLRGKLRAALNQAHIHQKNQWINEEDYYSDYFSMRLAQIRILRDMVNLLIDIDIDGLFVDELRQVLISTAENFAEGNDGKLILLQIEAVYQNYRQKPLPQTREEFENRALLFQFLQSFRSFIEIKAIFYQNEQKI